MALWLRDTSNTQDIVLVMPPTHTTLGSESVVLRGFTPEEGMPEVHGYYRKRFVELLREAAQVRLSGP
jgi:hypothetical protein